MANRLWLIIYIHQMLYPENKHYEFTNCTYFAFRKNTIRKSVLELFQQMDASLLDPKRIKK